MWHKLPGRNDIERRVAIGPMRGTGLARDSLVEQRPEARRAGDSITTARRTKDMQKTIGLAMIAIVCLALGASDARAQDAEVSANAGWVSQYYYRGILQKNSSASAGLDLAVGPVSVGTWSADVGDGAEVDLYGSLGVDLGGLSLSAGGIGYFYTGEFDDTYLEANFIAGAGPLSAEFSIGQYANFGDEQDYWFLGVTAEQAGFYGTFGTFGSDFSGSYGEAGYGFSAAELDFTISGILSDGDLAGDNEGDAELTLVFGVGKTFELQ